ncbi:MAG: hypothetical protein JY451_04995 [Erythrobacter sp.]|nr:MAG: hypothetical protein JY451_04995 [Erythrobacter sp.]
MQQPEEFRARWVTLVLVTLLLSACASQMPAAVDTAPQTPGFWWGIWHGFIFPFAWIGSLFRPDIAVYAVPNSGGWYDFGFFLGITVLGGGSFFGSRKRS